MDMELTDQTISKLARAMTLAPYEIVAESNNWTEGSKAAFARETKGQPITKHLQIFLEMKPGAEAALQREADAEAAQKAEFESIIAAREAKENATIEANKAQNVANQLAYQAQKKLHGDGVTSPVLLPETTEDLRLFEKRRQMGGGF